MDMEGKADGRALKTLLPHLNPKKIVSGAATVYFGRFMRSILSQVLIGGDKEATADLESTCRANATMTRDIYAPALEETVQVGDDAKSFSIRLEESLLGTIKLRRVRLSLCDHLWSNIVRRWTTTTLSAYEEQYIYPTCLPSQP